MIDAELTLADTKFTPAQLEAIRITAQQSHMGLGVATSVESVLREGGGSTEQIHSICCAECDPGFIQIFGAANRSE